VTHGHGQGMADIKQENKRTDEESKPSVEYTQTKQETVKSAKNFKADR